MLGTVGLLDFMVQKSLEKTFSESSKLLILTIPITVTQISNLEKL